MTDQAALLNQLGSSATSRKSAPRAQRLWLVAGRRRRASPRPRSRPCVSPARRPKQLQSGVAAAAETAPPTSPSSAAAPVASILDASGYVVARRQATVSAKITGKVVAVLIEEGQRVEAGEVIARLDDANARAQVAQAAGAGRAAAREPRTPRASRSTTPVPRSTATTQQFAAAGHQRANVSTTPRPATTRRRRVSTSRRARSRSPRRLSPSRSAISTTPSCARRSAASSPSRPRRKARWCRRSRPAAASRAPASARSSTWTRSRSRSTSARTSSAACETGQPVAITLNAYPDRRMPGRVIAIIPTADRAKATVKVRVGFDAARCRRAAGDGRARRIPAQRRTMRSRPWPASCR